ncbi:MAG TPA: class I SAM-dependent methyltransferase [Alphaproteobacteria bacterium]|nr:class I SAM-dependent methyltransferase [Alphaproteobacteria bacterium]
MSLSALRKTSDQTFEGLYRPTQNQTGFMLTSVDPFVKKFVDDLTPNDWAMDVGAAYGIASLEALKKGVHVVANDLDERHLQVLKDTHAQEGYKGHLTLFPGDIKTLEYPHKNTLSSILFSRVLHFFSGEEIIACLKKVHTWLKPKGRIYMVNETPFFGTCKKFTPVYLERKLSGHKWPGFLTSTEMVDFFDTSKKAFLDSNVHFFDEDLCEKVATRSGFKVLEISYMDRKGIYPTDALYDGRESIFMVAEKM